MRTIQKGSRGMTITLSQIIKDTALSGGMNDGKADAYAEYLAGALRENTEVLNEFVHYLRTGDFLCECRVCGLSIVDIMVWQIDHFKAHLDRGDSLKNNPGMMVLKAFETMIKMKDDPDRYMRLYGSETGTDYPGHHE